VRKRRKASNFISSSERSTKIEDVKLEALVALYKDLIKEPGLVLTEINEDICRGAGKSRTDTIRSRGRLSHYLRNMVKEGLIKVRQDGSRKKYVLTEKGKEIAGAEHALRALRDM
jgi:DNA-binding MarR family transcriptional regulator